AVCHSKQMLTDIAPSRAGSLPQGWHPLQVMGRRKRWRHKTTVLECRPHLLAIYRLVIKS
ncbi:hypothetical protein, partial [Pseudomonas sp. SWRI81]|uniref:hypothetical protein n=1 Tax=Pseudomonas sp. SWRI81 TaxID=2745505 RepID=UPI001EE166B4